MTKPPEFGRALDILKQLIRIDSVNPTLVPGSVGERQIAEYLFTLLQQEGIESHLEEVSPGRLNVVARVQGRSPGPRLLLNGHMDTVSVEGMAAPFEPVEREGRIYGRGSLDMKSGLAAEVAALLALAHASQRLRGEVVFVGVVDEEDLSHGTQHFLARSPREKPFDFALITEPTDLKVCSAHKGFAWLEVITRGVAAHGSRPKEGVDAIAAMGEVLRKLSALDRDVQSRPPHPSIGTGSLHASLIQGGREWSSYPDHCTLKYERRTVPGESEAHLERELQELLEQLSRDNPTFRASGRLVFSRAPLESDREERRVKRFFETARSILPDLVDWGAASFWTDAALLAEAGIPVLVFGPRGAGLHSLEEYVIAADVLGCAEVIYRFAMGDGETIETTQRE